MNEPQQKVDFDKYAERYEDILDRQLGFFSERDYFSKYKIAVVHGILGASSPRILDFGAGVGLSIPHLQNYFPDAEVVASDISPASLAHLKGRFPAVDVIDDPQIDGQTFDLILVITVLHHIAPAERNAVMKRLARALRPNGRLFIFEHNPYNPVTRRMVSTCEFDDDAILLTMRESKQLLEHAGLKVAESGYTLFFPALLSALRPTERWLRWLPAGGQYFVAGTQP